MTGLHKGLALWQAVIAGLSFVTGSVTLNGLVGPRVAGSLALLAGALQAGTLVYLAAVRVEPANAPPAPAPASAPPAPPPAPSSSTSAP